MKVLRFLPVIGFIFFLGCLKISANLMTYTGDGNETTEARSLPPFHDIELGGAYEVVLTQGNTSEVRIETDKNLLEHITTTVTNGKLVINSDGNLRPTNTIRVFITTPNYTSVELEGSGSVHGATPINSNALALDLSGSGEYDLDVHAKQLESRVEGSGTIKLSGNTDKHTVDIAGSGNIKGGDLIAQETAVNIEGSGNALVNVEHKLDASIAGSGSIRYRGASTEVHSNITGSGSVEHIN